jgi:steroid 5-alpha reductase family enzyme
MPSPFDMMIMIRTFLTSMIASLLEDVDVPWWQVVASLTALSCCVTIPATQYKPLYGFTVGYGASVGFIGWMVWRQLIEMKSFETTSSLLISSPNRLLPLSAAFYGFRLASYLLVRDGFGWKPNHHQTKTTTETSRWSRIPFAVSLSVLYGCLTCPLVYIIRYPAPTDSWEEAASVLASHAACAAALVEAIADAHKSICKYRAKRNKKNQPKSTADGGATAAAAAAKATFVGPTGGLYGITRHPNYGAEIAYWTAVWVCGMPSYGTRWGAWIASTLGWISVVKIMVGSTKRLEENQRKSYEDQPAYKEWIKNVPYPLLPGIE